MPRLSFTVSDEGNYYLYNEDDFPTWISVADFTEDEAQQIRFAFNAYDRAQALIAEKFGENWGRDERSES